VKAEDAKRLQELHKTLKKNKVSNEEIKEVLKRERRRAEKALSNSKKNVCYNCREVIRTLTLDENPVCTH
jgi:ribosomal protein L32